MKIILIKKEQKMKKNKLILAIATLSILSCFEVAAKLIPITIGTSGTYELATFISSSATGKTTRVTQNYPPDTTYPKGTMVIDNPEFTWYTFETTGYKGAQKSSGQYPHYLYIFIDESGSSTPSVFEQGKLVTSGTNTSILTLRTAGAAKGTFKLYGFNPMTKQTDENIGFAVKVK